MFDIGWTELLVIAVVAIIIVGPKDLPRMLRSLGRYAGKLKRTAGEFRAQFDDALRDSELDELRSTMREVGDLNPAGQIRDSVTESLDPLKDTADKIKSGIEDYGGSSGGSDGGAAEKKPAAAKSGKPPARRAKPAAKAGRAKKKPAAKKAAAPQGGG